MPATAGIIAPPVVVLSIDPETIFDIAKLVEVAPWSDVLPDTVRVGVVIAPADEIEVVPVCPTAKVFAENAVVDALEIFVAPLNVFVFVNVFAVYVFGIVVDAWMNACTRASV